MAISEGALSHFTLELTGSGTDNPLVPAQISGELVDAEADASPVWLPYGSPRERC